MMPEKRPIERESIARVGAKGKRRAVGKEKWFTELEKEVVKEAQRQNGTVSLSLRETRTALLCALLRR